MKKKVLAAVVALASLGAMYKVQVSFNTYKATGVITGLGGGSCEVAVDLPTGGYCTYSFFVDSYDGLYEGIELELEMSRMGTPERFLDDVVTGYSFIK